MASKGSIATFIAAIAANGGMSMSNGYDVEFDMAGTKVKDYLAGMSLNLPANNDSGEPGSLINMFCDEAQLPNSQAAVGELNGRYLGEGTIRYPHTKLMSDFSLTWMCDANMAPYKFITLWHNYIFTDYFDENDYDYYPKPDSLKDFKSVAKTREINRNNRLKYPNDYQATLRIAKTERGQNAPNSRVPLVYVIENCYPYSVDMVPLSYGSSQIVRVTANFYYSRHSIYYSDVRKFKG